MIAYVYITPGLPDIDTLKDVKLQVPLRVYSREGDLIAEFGEMKRSPLSYEEFPPKLIEAVLAAEDDRFFEHPGVDYQGILRAAFHLIRTGEKGQGGSTITMQVARNFFLSREKTFLRKFNEIFLALKIEDELSKEDILALYLNKIYLGKRAYGFAAAAQVYYGKKLDELSIAEIAMIAGLPKAPSRYNPVVNPERARIRRNYVLGRMHALAFISDEEYQAALGWKDVASVHGQDIDLEAPYIAEMARSAMLERFGEKAYTEGYKVVTTIESRHQKVANKSLRQALLEYDRRHGYRGTLGHVALFETGADNKTGQAKQQAAAEDEAGSEQVLSDEFDVWQQALEKFEAVGNLTPAVVIQLDEQAVYAYTAEQTVVHIPWDKLKWARQYIDDAHRGPELEKATDVLAEGDVIYTTPAQQPGCSWLAQQPKVGGALVALRPNDGSIQAAVGGFDFYESKFNRVIQAKRQPGSSFKPFIYTAALDKGYTAASVINDAPVVFDAPGLEDTWRPENYSGKFYGPTRLRQALIKSRNLVSIRLMRDIGIGYSVRYVERFGFDRTTLPRDLSLSLGSGSVTPLELAQGYAVFANGGYRVKANFIDHVLDSDDKIAWLPEKTRVCEACFKQDEDEEEQQVEADAVPEQEVKTEKTAITLLPQPVVELDENITPEERRQIFQGPQPQLVAPQVLSPQTAFLINTMMRDVVNYGTGRRALSIGRKDLAGKTGTTNDQRDAWFAGFNRDVVTIAWVGFDNPRPLGHRETGAIAALPMWIDYMQAALKGAEEKPLVQPKGIVSVRIDPKTGKLASARTVDAIFEYFLEDQVPTETQEIQPALIPGEEGQPAQSGASDITEQLF
ncbi:MAG: penicillin-binding protein 1A [Thioalkalispiraceae bacterium]